MAGNTDKTTRSTRRGRGAGAAAEATEAEAAPTNKETVAPTTANDKKRPAAASTAATSPKKAKKTDTSSTTEAPSSASKTGKSDGRTKNKGAAKRKSYSIEFKLKTIQDYEAWEAEQRKLVEEQGESQKGSKDKVKEPTVRQYVLAKNLGVRYYKFLSPTSGWRHPDVKARIMADAGNSDYKDMSRMTDRTKNKSYYADMEEALLVRMEDCRNKHVSVNTKTIRTMAKEELKKLVGKDDPEKVKNFKASNGWVYNFMKRQERKATDEKKVFEKIKGVNKKRKGRQAKKEEAETSDAKAADTKAADAKATGAKAAGDVVVQPDEAADAAVIVDSAVKQQSV